MLNSDKLIKDLFRKAFVSVLTIGAVFGGFFVIMLYVAWILYCFR